MLLHNLTTQFVKFSICRALSLHQPTHPIISQKRDVEPPSQQNIHPTGNRTIPGICDCADTQFVTIIAHCWLSRATYKTFASSAASDNVMTRERLLEHTRIKVCQRKLYYNTCYASASPSATALVYMAFVCGTGRSDIYYYIINIYTRVYVLLCARCVH